MACKARIKTILKLDSNELKLGKTSCEAGLNIFQKLKHVIPNELFEVLLFDADERKSVKPYF